MISLLWGRKLVAHSLNTSSSSESMSVGPRFPKRSVGSPNIVTSLKLPGSGEFQAIWLKDRIFGFHM